MVKELFTEDLAVLSSYYGKDGVPTGVVSVEIGDAPGCETIGVKQ
jgi:hypothetical protein